MRAAAAEGAAKSLLALFDGEEDDRIIAYH